MKNFKIENSPFLDDKEKRKNVFHEEVKNVDDDFILVRKKYYQSNEYVKIILQKEREISKYVNMSNTAKNVLYYILNILEYNSPTFRLKINTVMLFIKKSEPTIYRGINELIKNNYIQKTNTKEVYWINHNYFFKGNYTYKYTAKKDNQIRKNQENEPSIFKNTRQD